MLSTVIRCRYYVYSCAGWKCLKMVFHVIWSVVLDETEQKENRSSRKLLKRLELYSKLRLLLLKTNVKLQYDVSVAERGLVLILKMKLLHLGGKITLLNSVCCPVRKLRRKQFVALVNWEKKISLCSCFHFFVFIFGLFMTLIDKTAEVQTGWGGGGGLMMNAPGGGQTQGTCKGVYSSNCHLGLCLWKQLCLYFNPESWRQAWENQQKQYFSSAAVVKEHWAVGVMSETGCGLTHYCPKIVWTLLTTSAFFVLSLLSVELLVNMHFAPHLSYCDYGILWPINSKCLFNLWSNNITSVMLMFCWNSWFTVITNNFVKSFQEFLTEFVGLKAAMSWFAAKKPYFCRCAAHTFALQWSCEGRLL